MLQIKQQSQPTPPKYAFATHITPKQYITRINKNINNEICKTLETQESITQPMANRQPQPYTQYFNDNYYSISEQTAPKHQNTQGLTYTFVSRTIPTYDIEQLLREITMIRFLSGQVSSQEKFITRKEEVIRKVKIQIEEKQAQVSLQKKRYDRKIKKNNEKKVKLRKLDQLMRRQQTRQELQWTARITNLRLELKQQRQLMRQNQYYYRERHEHEEHNNKKRRDNLCHKIQIPIFLPQQGQCYTARSNYDPRYNPYQQDFYSQVNDYNPQSAREYPPQFNRTASKNISHQKFKTQSTDGFYTKRQSKLAPKYLQDFDEQQRERQPVTDRKHSRRSQNKTYNKTISNVFLEGMRSVEYDLISNMQLGLQSNKKEQNNIFKKHQNNEPKSRPIKKVQSETISAELSSFREESGKQNNDDDLGVLLEQSITKEESKYMKTIVQKQKQPDFSTMISVNKNEDKNTNTSSKPQQLFFKLQSADNHKQKHHSIPQQYGNHSMKMSPIKQTHIKESTVKIEMSDQDSSKISRRERQRSIYDEAQKKQYRESIAEVCALIEQESQETSMRTTPNNQLSPKQISENDKTTSVTPTPSHSSKKPKTNDQKNQTIIEQELFPLAHPPKLIEVRDHEGISKIQLNTMSKQSRDLLKECNQLLKRKNSDDDNLMTITLVGQSKISRLKTQFKAVLRQEQIVQRNYDQIENRDKVQKNSVALQEKDMEKSSDLDFDFQLSAESNYFSKSKFSKANQSISPRTNNQVADPTKKANKLNNPPEESEVLIQE